ncbi:hypothetical protein PC9H_005961 [Pleurotus ostreatus]|uniref:Uncharacterized protein n=1 Tax=Pleurotus ostreatus TaxID=5322 RepID=A0A8H6ZT79_PLEOS|nr:uncharacterized protein PC9H_005961 [Pleurotus ostreatus]KAF7430259.1 hypothetical protein PC9H_005961 [Pleurotus ostreatus]KAJ8701348.1 hypothetical protein PTI98_000147 [Pleurotus ostreatus]
MIRQAEQETLLYNSSKDETEHEHEIYRKVEGYFRRPPNVVFYRHHPALFLVLRHSPRTVDGPSTDALDAAWSDLYDIYTYKPRPRFLVGRSDIFNIVDPISSLTTEENGRRVDPTVPAFGNVSQLYEGLDVSHQLHCLVSALLFEDMYAGADLLAAKDYARKALEPERYGGADGRRASFMDKRKATTDLPHVSAGEHVSHCLDMIRQSLVCSADISVISWYMPIASSAEHTPNSLPRFDQTRMCRDFDRLRDWARSRTPDAEGLEGVMPHGDGEGR